MNETLKINIDERINEKLKEPTDKACEAADALCEALRAFEKIDFDDMTEEEKKYCGAILMEGDHRRNMILRRILFQFGNLLFL